MDKTLSERARRRGRRNRARVAAQVLRGQRKAPLELPPELRRWTHRGLTCIIRKPDLGPTFLFYNGYVVVPPEHPWYLRGYSDKRLADVSVHGGLTYAALWTDGWVFGFDTGHAGDVWPGAPKAPWTLTDVSWRTDWTMERLERETERLAEQLAEAQD